MAQDNDKVLYVAYVNGIKIFDGAVWHILEIQEDVTIRRLYFDGQSRVYFGGSGLFGYVYKDAYGRYQFKNITPKEYLGQFEDTWHISSCGDDIAFISLYTFFLYNQLKGTTKSWDFTAKLGAAFCNQNKFIVQDREVGLRVLEGNNWLNSSIKLTDNQPIDKFQYLDEKSIFILSHSEDWRVIQNNHINHLDFKKELLTLDNYVSIASLGDGKIVLGANNGLLTFVDTNTLKTQSFQLTNEWISEIISKDGNELIVLTEFEIFYIQWPSALRIQGKDTGLASRILDVKPWNDSLYVASSAGVFLENKQQLAYQHKLFNRLNWTNKEAWNIFPINNKQLLLAESHELMLVNHSAKETTIESISDTIYPRELMLSKYNPKLIFVTTELDVQLLYKNKTGWQFRPFYSHRPLSIIEDKPGSVLISTIDGGVLQFKFDLKKGDILKKEKVGSLYQLDSFENESTGLLLTQSQEIIAYNAKGVFKIHPGKPPDKIFPQLAVLLEELEIKKLLQSEDGMFYGFSHFKLFYQDGGKKWHVLDMSQHLQGIIDRIRIIGNEVKILSTGVIVTYLKDKLIEKKPIAYTLHMTHVSLNKQGLEQLLPVNPTGSIKFEQGDVVLTFSYALNDLKNHTVNQYRSQLIGESDVWSDYSNNSKRQIVDLTAGEYVLNVQAKDTNAKVYTMDAYHFTVSPPWYFTKLAKLIWIIMALLLLVLLLHLLLRWREKVHVHQKQELKTIIDNKTRQLEKANVSLKKMAHLDGLTGLSNRYYLDEYINNLTHQDQEVKNIVVMMMDMDDFKLFNDRHGHMAGDDLLKKTAQFLMLAIDRPSDIIARYGGEEFLVIMLDCSKSVALEKAEEIRKLIENKEKNTSISIGVCESSNQKDLKSLDAIYHLIDQADKALYSAKNTGRNKIVIC